MNDRFGCLPSQRAFTSQARAKNKTDFFFFKKVCVLFTSLHIPQDLPYSIMMQRVGEESRKKLDNMTVNKLMVSRVVEGVTSN